jgi:predicted dehydrogenase
MKTKGDRRRFIRTAGLAAAGLGITGNALGETISLFSKPKVAGTRVGIIGLDTSHSIAFAKALNDPAASADFSGYKVVAAYPFGSRDLKSSFDRIAGYTEDIKKLDVQISSSIDELLKVVDVVLLETNDGRLHLEQALKVIKAGKPFFIDKPVAASLQDAADIFAAAKKANVPVFSSSSLRYTPGAQDIVKGKIGKVLGADTYGPASLESTHPDLFWYGIHGIETLYTLMGTGCKQVVRVNTPDTDVVIGTWGDGRIGTFRGTRSGKPTYGGTAFGEKGAAAVGDYGGYNPLLVKIIEFFRTKVVPVEPDETMEIYAFMEAAHMSTQNNGAPVTLASVYGKLKR